MPAKAAKENQEFDFEKALSELEQLVERMETGELPLEETLKQFERGIELGQRCQAALESAEQKVQMLIRKSGGDEIADFEPEE